MTGALDLSIGPLIRSTLVRDGHRYLMITWSSKGWQANLKNHDGSYRVEIADDPCEAIRRLLVPYQLRWVIDAEDAMNQRRSPDDPLKQSIDLFGPLTEVERRRYARR